MPGSILVVASYVLLAIFVIAFFRKAFKINKLPVHLRWELAPVPHEKGRSHYGGSYFEEFEWWTKPREKSLVTEIVYMMLEIVFLKAMWEHNRRLWWFSFPFHFGMYLLIVATAILVLGGALDFAGVSILSADVLRKGITTLAGAGYVLGSAGALGLLISRLSDPKLRAIATPASLFNLVFLLAVFITGGWALRASGDSLARILVFVKAMFTADLSVQISGVLAAHLVVTFLFLAYLPFTQMMHFVAKYFTYHQVRWDDEPLVPGGAVEKEVQTLLQQPVTWSAPHLKADGKKNWVDIATEEVQK